MKNAHYSLVLGLNKSAKMINTNPNNEIMGPTVIRRKLKTSGLNSLTVPEPDIKINPITMITKPMAISNMLVFASVNFFSFSILFKNYFLILLAIKQLIGMHVEVFSKSEIRRK